MLLGGTHRFGVFDLDARKGQLTKAGIKLRIQQQPLQILIALLECPGELVTREDLRQKLWPGGTFVDFEHGVNVAIRRLRQTLGDDAGNPRYVETVAKTGYRFIAPVTRVAVVHAPEPLVPRRHPKRVAAVAAVAAAALALLWVAYYAGRRMGVNPMPEYQQATFRYGFVSNARFGADGHTIAYSARWDGKPSRVYAGMVGSAEARELAAVERAGLFSLSSRGEAALGIGATSALRESGQLLARCSLNGSAARNVLKGVIDADWSPDGETFAILRHAGGKYRIEYPVGKVLYESDQFIFLIRAAPVGHSVAFLAPIDGALMLAVVSPDGLKKLCPVNGLDDSRSLAWTPDGGEIWLNSFEEPGVILAVRAAGPRIGATRVVARLPGHARVMDIARDGEVLLAMVKPYLGILYTGPDGREHELSWMGGSRLQYISPDGKTIAFNEEGERGVRGRTAAYRRDTDGSAAVRLGDGYMEAVSPDWKLFSITPTYAQRTPVLTPSGPGEVRRVQIDGLEEGSYRVVAWLPGGGYLVHGRQPGRQSRYFVWTSGPQTLRPVSPEGIASQPNTLVTGDGTRFLSRGVDGEWRLFPFGGGDAQPVAGLMPKDQPVNWYIDGRSLFFVPEYDLSLSIPIYRLDLATHVRTPWKEVRPLTTVDLMTRLRITPDGKSYAYTYHRSLSVLYVARGLR